MSKGFNEDNMFLMQGADADQLRSYADIHASLDNEVEEFDPIAELKKHGVVGLPEPLELNEKVLEECQDCESEDTIRTLREAMFENAVPVGGSYEAEKAEYEASGSKQGMRFNKGKARYDLLPPEGLAELVNVYTMGAEKYAPRNWEKGISVTGCFASIMRHSFAWLRGETRDPESGLHHMGHVAWNAIAIVTFYYRKMEDDRPVILPEE